MTSNLLLQVQALHYLTFSLNFLTTLCMVVTHFDCSHLQPLLLSSHHGQHPSLPEGLFLVLISFCFVSWTSEFNQGHLNDLGSGIIHWNLWRLVGSPMGTQLKTMISLPLVFFSSHEFSTERWGSVSPSHMADCWHVWYCANPVQIIGAAMSSWWLSHTQEMTFHGLSLHLPTPICFLPILVWYFLSFLYRRWYKCLDKR